MLVIYHTYHSTYNILYKYTDILSPYFSALSPTTAHITADIQNTLDPESKITLGNLSPVRLSPNIFLGITLDHIGGTSPTGHGGGAHTSHSTCATLDWSAYTSSASTVSTAVAVCASPPNSMSPRLLRTHSDLETLFASASTTTVGSSGSHNTTPTISMSQQQQQHQHHLYSGSASMQHQQLHGKTDGHKYDDAMDSALELSPFKNDCVLSMDQAFANDSPYQSLDAHSLDFHPHHQQLHQHLHPQQQQHHTQLMQLDEHGYEHQKQMDSVLQHQHQHQHHQNQHQHQQHNQHHQHQHQQLQQQQHQHQLQLIELDMHSFNLHHDDLTADDMEDMHDKANEALLDLEKPILNITVNESGVGGSAADQYFID